MPVTQDEINLELENGLEIFSKNKHDEYYSILTNHRSENKQAVWLGRKGTEIGEISKLGKTITNIASDDEVRKKMEEAGRIFEKYEQRTKEGCEWTHDIQ